MTLTGTESTTRDTALILSLAAGSTPTDAAAKTGLSRRTVYRRLDDPAFRDRVQSERDNLVSSMLGRLADASLIATETLRSVAADEEAPLSARISSSKAILDYALRAREQVELVDRLRAVEDHLNPTELR